MEQFNFRLAEEKNFHSEVLLFSFNPEHDIIVICLANGEVNLSVSQSIIASLSRSLPIKRISVKYGH